MQRKHQHLIVRSLTNGEMESVIQLRMFDQRNLFVVLTGGEHFFITAGYHNKISLGSQRCRKPCRFTLQQCANVEQIVQRSRLRAEQMN